MPGEPKEDRIWRLSQAMFLLLLVFSHATELLHHVLLEVCEQLERWMLSNEDDDVHLGQHRMVPQQTSDQDENVSYFGELMWQEMHEQLEASHTRLRAYRLRNLHLQRHCLPVPETTGHQHERQMAASADIATQTMPEEGTIVDAPARTADSVLPEGVTANQGTHGGPLGHQEIQDNHPLSTALHQAADSGYGSQPQNSQDQNQGQDDDQKMGQACYIPGLSESSQAPAVQRNQDGTMDTDFERNITDSNSQVEDPD